MHLSVGLYACSCGVLIRHHTLASNRMTNDRGNGTSEQGDFMTAGALKVVKIASGAVDVSGDLFAESFDVRELDFWADTLEEVDFDFGLRSDVDGMEVEEMSLNCK